MISNFYNYPTLIHYFKLKRKKKTTVQVKNLLYSTKKEKGKGKQVIDMDFSSYD